MFISFHKQLNTINKKYSLLESRRSGLRSVRCFIFSLFLTSEIQTTYVMSSLSSKINESRNESKEYNTVHYISSSPLESVREILLDTIVFLYPDVLTHSGFTKVSTIQSSNCLRCSFKQRTSTIHSIFK